MSCGHCQGREQHAQLRCGNVACKGLRQKVISTAILYRGNDPLPVGRRAVALLSALAKRPGIVLSKRQPIEAAWPGLAVEDSNLTVQIASLRRALASEPGGERWIETMPRRSYRFVGPAASIV